MIYPNLTCTFEHLVTCARKLQKYLNTFPLFDRFPLQGSQLNASMLEAAVSKLEPRIPNLKQQAEDLTPLVDMAKEYANNLTRQAEYLDGSVVTFFFFKLTNVSFNKTIKW